MGIPTTVARGKISDPYSIFSMQRGTGRKLDVLNDGTLLCDDAPHAVLRPCESALLVLFMRNFSQLLPKERLTNSAGSSGISATTLTTKIAAIRRKITGTRYQIVSIYGEGYRCIVIP